ncbi:MAG: short-chain dehydrogenase/reductase [marine bacterium B5-7]|nr:MAG: short-chain dehydrogenase/reductase [marine bacterium B5-7]
MTLTDDPRRIILITGCSSGIGRAAAFGLPAERYRVFATARRLADVKSLREAGLESTLLDLNDSISINNALSYVLDRSNGRLDALVNNAAFGQPGAVEDLSRRTLKSQFETNLFGTHELTCACLPIFRSQAEGRIIQVSSILGRICLAYRGAYNASKYALEALSDTLRLELRGSGIQISIIEPGPVESRFRDNSLHVFLDRIDIDSSHHSTLYQKVLKRLESTSNTAFTMPADAIVKPLRHALESRRPRTRYPLTIPARILPMVKRFLSDRAMDRILEAAGDKPD